MNDCMSTPEKIVKLEDIDVESKPGDTVRKRALKRMLKEDRAELKVR